MIGIRTRVEGERGKTWLYLQNFFRFFSILFSRDIRFYPTYLLSVVARRHQKLRRNQPTLALPRKCGYENENKDKPCLGNAGLP